MASERKTIELNQYGQYKVTLSKEVFASVKKELAKIENDYDGENPEGTTFVFYEKAIRQLEKAMNGEEVFEYWMNVAKAIGLETNAFTGTTMKGKVNALAEAGYTYKVDTQGGKIEYVYNLGDEEIVRSNKQTDAINQAYTIFTSPVPETSVIEAEIIAPESAQVPLRGNGLEYFNRLAERETARLEREYCERAKMRVNAIIKQLETPYGLDTSYAHEACVTSIFIAFPQQLDKLLSIIERHTHGSEIYDYQHKMNDKPQTLLPALRELVQEFTVENMTNAGKLRELPSMS